MLIKESLEMEQKEEIVTLEIEGDFTVCPECGYEGGFHSIFPNYKKNSESKWILICPNCHAKYDIGLVYRP
jgi:hypothetical protein